MQPLATIYTIELIDDNGCRSRASDCTGGAEIAFITRERGDYRVCGSQF